MDYREYLKSMGATDEDLKVLDTPVARKAYDKVQADLVAASAKATAAETKVAGYQKWYEEEAVPTYAKMEKERNTALSDAAAERARLKSLQDAGLIDVAADQAAKDAAAAEAARRGDQTFDPSKYDLVTMATLTSVADREGDAIAIAQDIANEHQQLFGSDPSKRLNFRELRKEAVAQKKSVETLWMEKYGVQAARDKQSADARAAHDKAVADAAIADYRSKNSVTNPLLGPSTPSANPFTGKVPSASDATQPWLRSDTERVNARLDKMRAAHPDLLN